MGIRNRVKSLLKPGGGLSQRAARSGVWVYATNITERVFSLIRIIILARLLAPHDFGLVGVALLAISALTILTVTGFEQALVQKKGDIKDYLDTAWSVAVMRGVILALVLFGMAPLVSTFFESPAVSSILRVVAISCVLQGLTNIGIIYFKKELEFGKRFIYQLSGTVVDMAVAITAAIIMRNAWALVFGLLAGSLVRCLVSYVIHPYRPRFNFQLGQAKELFTFGKWLLGASIVVFLATQGDDAFLGKVLGVTMLGFYQMAFRFGNLPASEIGLISRVAFPTYSKLQDNIPVLRDTYLRVIRLVTFAAIPFAGGIFILAPQFTQLFLGDKWMPIVPALMIFAISVVIREIASTGGALFYAVGRPDIAFKQDLAWVITMAIAIYPLTMLWGMTGTALAVLLAVCPRLPIWIWGSVKLGRIKKSDFSRTLLPPLVSTAIMCAVIFGLGKFIDQFQWLWFLTSVVIGMATYFGFTLFFEKISDYKVFKDVGFILDSLRSGDRKAS